MITELIIPAFFATTLVISVYFPVFLLWKQLGELHHFVISTGNKYLELFEIQRQLIFLVASDPKMAQRRIKNYMKDSEEKVAKKTKNKKRTFRATTSVK